MMGNLSITTNSSINQTLDQLFENNIKTNLSNSKENKENSSVLSCFFTSSSKQLIGSNRPFLTRLIYAFTFVCEVPLSRLTEV